jgi:protein-disulfide isomerase
LIVTHRVFTLSVAGLAILAGPAPLHRIDGAMAQSAVAALVAKPSSLPGMALGPPKASATIVEYASMTCPHCSASEQNVFPMLKSRYVSTPARCVSCSENSRSTSGAAAVSMLARFIANNDAGKYFEAVDLLFKQQDQLMSIRRLP